MTLMQSALQKLCSKSSIRGPDPLPDRQLCFDDRQSIPTGMKLCKDMTSGKDSITLLSMS